MFAAYPAGATADGKERPLVRKDGKVIATLRQFGRLEQVLGPYGGQFASFEWVFSPKGADGRPLPVFDRATGAIDKQVVAYWRDHYDVAHIVARDDRIDSRSPRSGELGVERVEACGAIEGQAGDAAVDVDEQRRRIRRTRCFVAHFGAIRIAPSRRIVSPLR